MVVWSFSLYLHGKTERLRAAKKDGYSSEQRDSTPSDTRHPADLSVFPKESRLGVGSGALALLVRFVVWPW
jgi:hypothetical protein